jgi:hypothetical protein
MAANYLDIYIEQGTDYVNQITLDDSTGAPYDLTNFNIFASAKTSYYTANATIVFDASVYDAANGIIQIGANSAITSNVSSAQTLVYDVIVQDTVSGVITRVLEGQIFVSPGVTNINLTY